MLVAASSPDGHSLATLKHGSKSGKRCGRIRLYPVSGCKSKLSAELPNYVNGLAFPPDGKRLYAAVDNHSLRQSRRPRPHVCVPPRRTVDGHAGTGREKNWQIPNAVLVYEVFAGRLIARLKSAACQSIAFSPYGRLPVASNADVLYVWQITTGQKLLHLPAKDRLTNWAGSRSSPQGT